MVGGRRTTRFQGHQPVASACAKRREPQARIDHLRSNLACRQASQFGTLSPQEPLRRLSRRASRRTQPDTYVPQALLLLDVGVLPRCQGRFYNW